MLLSVNRLLVSYIDKCICKLNHTFLTMVSLTIFQLYLLRNFSIVTMHDNTVFQKQVVSETFFSVVYSNSKRSPNKYICQFLQCVVMYMNEIAQNIFF